ncbi:disintegrin and metalloproteinase domain-containing protein 2-like isoform 5-T5 [Liasis olivaceus]
MARLALPLALLAASFLAAQGSQRSFLQVIVPQRNPSHATGNKERMSFDMNIEGKSYSIYLKQQAFLSNYFRVYTYNRDGTPVSFAPSLQRDCYYQGYVDGYADSVVMLSSCSGLSGLIQIQNISYGIEPIESASGFRHLVFRTDYNVIGFQISKQNYSIKWSTGVTSKKDPAEPINFATLRYVEMHVIVAKSLYDYMGSNEDLVTGKIMQLMNFLNTMFYKLNVKIILSSLELWINKDKIPTTGTAEQLLEQFLHWKKDHLALRPHDVSFLFVYRNKAGSVGSIFAKKMCSKPSSGGTAMECENHPCCESDCTLKRGMQCAQGDCCWERRCRLKARGALCRQPPDEDCDLKEFCNGTSAECTEDHYVQDGQWCERESGVCMKGVCQSADRWCRKIFGQNSRSGTPQCYEEINSQKDRMGHCGSTARGYQSCQWQDLKCGKLVCEYPNRVPFFMENAAIIYAKVQNRLCVTLDYMKGPGVKDPFLVRDGTTCAKNKICMNQKCVDRAIIRLTCDAEKKCHGKGKCNNKGNCHCNMGWAPPDCGRADKGGLGGSIDSSFRSGLVLSDRQPKTFSTRNWLLVGFFVFLPVVIGSLILVIKLRQALLHANVEEEKDEEEEYDTEGSKSPEGNQSESASV